MMGRAHTRVEQRTVVAPDRFKLAHCRIMTSNSSPCAVSLPGALLASDDRLDGPCGDLGPPPLELG